MEMPLAWSASAQTPYSCKGRHPRQEQGRWVLKGIAVLQITWLVLSVAVRGIAGLPVTQLEIATIAFAVFAIATYTMNFWKPKDISRPTKLQVLPDIMLATDITVITPGQTQGFMLRLRSPAQAAKVAYSGVRDMLRVPNDVIWMEGSTPLMFVLMAISSLLFGGLHCVAWNFEFPSRAELILWYANHVWSSTLYICLADVAG